MNRVKINSPIMNAHDMENAHLRKVVARYGR